MNKDPHSERELVVLPLRRMDYAEALEKQKELVRECIAADGACSYLMFVEHPPVITLGRSADAADMKLSKQTLRRRGVDVVETNRGGKITFHGPGQLVAYPVMDLRPSGPDLHMYLRRLEAWIIDVLAAFGVDACADRPHTGVWVGKAKIASIGIAVRRWVAYHGVAINVNTEMDFFNFIVPCGLNGVKMTSLESVLGRRIPLKEVAAAAESAFKKRFGLPCPGMRRQ